MNTRVLYTLFSALVIIGGSLVAIRVAQGYRFSNQKRIVQGTGLLVANSFPSGAEVTVDGKLFTATDDTQYLEPGVYDVMISKDGYSSWQKRLTIEQELVTQTNAQLFRRVPGLSPLTFVGATNLSPSPDGEKLLFYTASASSKTRSGLYLLELSSNLLSNQREPRQISEDPESFDLATASFVWSPDNSEVIASNNGRDILLDLSRKNDLSNSPDIGLRKSQLIAEWEAELYLRERQFLGRFPAEIIDVATRSAQNVYLSPDKKKILYTAKTIFTLPENISPSLPATNTQPENRTVEPGKTYIYDREEDKNFLITYDNPQASASAKLMLATDLSNRDAQTLIGSPSAFLKLSASTSAQTAQNFASYYSSLYSHQLQWFPDSRHLLYTQGGKIYLKEYDNTNETTVYEGPFISNFIYPWPDGSKILILASFSPSTPANLYAIELK